MSMEKFFENVYREARATKSFKEWWSKQFLPDGAFYNKKVSVEVKFLTANKLYLTKDEETGDDKAITFDAVLYDPSEKKLPTNIAKFKSLDNLKMAIKTNLENVVNNEDNQELDDDEDEDTLGYKLDDKFNGPRNSKVEVILNEGGMNVEGIVLRTFKTDIQKDHRYLPWVFNTADGRIESYSNYDDKATESPYVDGLGIPLDKRGFYSDIVQGKLFINFTAEEPENKEEALTESKLKEGWTKDKNKNNYFVVCVQLENGNKSVDEDGHFGVKPPKTYDSQEEAVKACERFKSEHPKKQFFVSNDYADFEDN